jgi:hypothetical protein
MNIIFLNALLKVILNIFAAMSISTIHFITWGKKLIRFVVLRLLFFFLIKKRKIYLSRIFLNSHLFING